MHIPAFQEHIHSYYAASRNDHTVYPSLSGKLEVDSCVIGGGLAGISTALPLAEAGHSVALIEAARIGFGASGRNGGQIINGWAADMANIAAAAGADTARSLWNFSLEGVELIKTRIARLGIHCDWQPGYATVAVTPRHMADLQQWQHMAANIYGYHHYQLWTQAQLQTQLASRRYVGALYDPEAGHLHPLNYCLGLARAATAAGARLFEHTPMTGIYRQQGDYVLQTPAGNIRAKQVVLAVNAFTDNLRHHLFQPIENKILPVGTYMIATEPLGHRADDLIHNHMAVCDTRFVLDYYRLSADKRLLFGGKVNYSGREPTTAALKHSMRRDMLKVFPQLADVAIDYAWGGQVDISMSRAPHFGRLAPNLYFMQGFSGHGVAATGIGGLITAEAMLGNDQRLRIFEQLSHRPFPGGRRLRLPAQWLGVAYYRLKDLLR